MSDQHERYEAQLLETFGRIESLLDRFFTQARHYPRSSANPPAPIAAPWPVDPNAPKELDR